MGINLRTKVAAALWIIFIILLFFIRNAYALSTEVVPFGEVCLEVYVIALDGVDGHGVSNITRVVDAVIYASKPCDGAIHYLIEPPPELVLGELKINATVTIIRGWDEYRRVVETCSRAIIVNAHGETIPIPSSYTREEWIDKIAEALAYRNVTWVHTAGYPFYYIHHQESGISVWGEKGFKRLMSHIGKSNVTCHPHPPATETDIVLLHEDCKYYIAYGWPKLLLFAYLANRGKPLNATEFKDSCVAIIWGTDYYYMTGAVIKFATTNGTNSFGFYVHVGTYQTYTDDRCKTDADYFRGYTGTGMAVWACAWRFAAEEAISDAEKAIVKAEFEGRTNGLDDAKRLIQEAKSLFRRPQHRAMSADIATWKAIEARNVASNALKPSFLEVYALPLAVLGSSSTIAITVLAIKYRKNLKNKRRNRISQV